MRLSSVPAVALLAAVTFAMGVALGGNAHAVLAANPASQALGSQDSADGSQSCRSAPSAAFTDTAGNTHERAIDCVVWHGIALGTTDTTYAPLRPVTRGQMASFLARFIDTVGGSLPAGRNQFHDVADNAHRANIERLAAGGIVHGVGGGRYNPNAAVTRAQMASFLVRTYEFVHGDSLPVTSVSFTDIAGNTHENNIKRAAAAGLARGRTPTSYAPAADVRRDQMASFLARMLDPDAHAAPEPDSGGSGRANPVDPAAAVRTVSRGTRTVDCTGNLSSVRPGDVVALEAGTRGDLRIDNCHGTPNAPIVFVNAGGVVNVATSADHGISVRSSSHIRVTGTGVTSRCGVYEPFGGSVAALEAGQRCGIVVDGSRLGVAVKDYGFAVGRFGNVDVGVEVDHVEITNTRASGVSTNANDIEDSRYTTRGFHFHHLYVHDVGTISPGGGEGFYVGPTSYPRVGKERVADVHIHHNLVARIARDGIQLSSIIENSTPGFHDNVVYRAGLSRESSHGQGIAIQPGTTGDVWNNVVMESSRQNINMRGLGDQNVYNNLSIRAGDDGIRVSSDGSVRVLNNTVVDARERGLADSSGATWRNNISVGSRDTNFRTTSGTVASHNLTSGDPRFVDPASDNYRLRSGSPAIGAGTGLSAFFTHDLLGTPRPQGNAWDIGAYGR